MRRLVFFLLSASILISSVPGAGAEASSDAAQRRQVMRLTMRVADAHHVPRWFLLAIVHRESSFDPNDVSLDDGIEGDQNWNSQNFDCAFTQDGYPHGVGLTKLTGWMYQGSPYPYCLEEPDNSHKAYYYSMAKQVYGEWINMEDVSRLDDPFDPRQNLERFLTGYAVPAYALFAGLYPDEPSEEIWRRVAFHWNKGLYVEYDPQNTDYLERYDQYVQMYQRAGSRALRQRALGRMNVWAQASAL